MTQARRNDPCPCGSGVKYKKCCLNKGSNSQLVVSSALSEKLKTDGWYHGSYRRFSRWNFKPEAKDHLTVPHSALFFTTNKDYALGAGPNLAKVSVRDSARVLDTTANYDGSERLRQELAKHPAMALLLNVEQRYWHNGWETGDVLRAVPIDDRFGQHLSQIVDQLMSKGMNEEAAKITAQANTTRGLIEEICRQAKKLGFDAIYGHEIDRHSRPGNNIAQPWLAVMTPGVITDPEWV